MVKKKKSKVNNIKKQQDKKEKQAFWFFLIIILTLSTAILTPYIYHEVANKFVYGGVPFEKVKYGQLIFYQGVFPVIYQGELKHYYNVYFRTDPRKNNITTNAEFKLSKNVSISLSKELEICNDLVLAQTELGKFISAFPWVTNVDSGVFENEKAQELNVTQIDCSLANLDNTVFIYKLSEQPSIILEKENCYVFNVGKCQTLQTTERYIIATMAQINGKELA